MNRLRSILFAFCGLSICVCSNAQDAIEGPNLNIGSGNTLNGNRGNAIGISHWLGGNNSLAVGNNDTIMDDAIVYADVTDTTAVLPWVQSIG